MSKAKNVFGFVKDLKNNESMKKALGHLRRVFEKADGDELSKTKVGGAVVVALATAIAILEFAFQISDMLQ